VQVNRTATNSNVVGVAIVDLPTGTTGDVVVTLPRQHVRCAIQLYRLIDCDSSAAADTDTSVSDDPSWTLDVPAGGVAIGCAMNAHAGATVDTWTGLTEDFADFVEGTLSRMTSASDEFATEQTALAIDCNWNNNADDCGVVISWAEDAGGGERSPSIQSQVTSHDSPAAMPLTDSQFERVYAAVSDNIRRERRLQFRSQVRHRDRLLDRKRLRPLVDRGWKWLETNRESDGDLRDGLTAHLRANGETFGVPVWILAIFLKVLVSILIDVWLLGLPVARAIGPETGGDCRQNRTPSPASRENPESK
jgi:hypothetical protein